MEQVVNNHPDLRDVLSRRTVVELKELAKGYYVKGTSQMNKAALVDAVFNSLMESERLAELLYVLDTETYTLFRRAGESQQPIEVRKPDSEQYRLLNDLCYLVCTEGADSVIVSVPIQICDVFELLKEEGFLKRKERFDLLHNYAMAAIHLYGVITQDEFVEIFNQQNSRKTSVDELFPILLRHIAVGAPYCFWDECIVCDGFEDNDFEDVKDLIRESGDKPRYIPEKKELLRYADWDYYENTAQTDKLKQFLATKRLNGVSSVDEIVAELQYSCTIEAGTQQIFDTLDECGLSIKNSEMKAFIDIIMGMKNNTRLWANKGHTPNELAALYGVPSLLYPSKPSGKRKVGRNEPCPCGSGKKYKKCCGR